MFMEAELNSPMVSLAPGQSYAMDTEWFPTRMGKELSSVSSTGVTGTTLAAQRTAKGIRLTGSFGVFFAGTLKLGVFDALKTPLTEMEVVRVDPKESLKLDQEIAVPAATRLVSLHFIDLHGVDRGELGTAKVQPNSGSL
jgi:hypothetical protein